MQQLIEKLGGEAARDMKDIDVFNVKQKKQTNKQHTTPSARQIILTTAENHFFKEDGPLGLLTNILLR